MRRLASIALLAAACTGSPPASQPPPIDLEAIERLAETRSYRLGFPHPVALLPDGDVLFLRTGPRSTIAEAALMTREIEFLRAHLGRPIAASGR